MARIIFTLQSLKWNSAPTSQPASVLWSLLVCLVRQVIAGDRQLILLFWQFALQHITASDWNSAVRQSISARLLPRLRERELSTSQIWAARSFLSIWKVFSSKSFFIIKRKYCKIQLQLERTSAIHNDCSEGDGAQNVFFWCHRPGPGCCHYELSITAEEVWLGQDALCVFRADWEFCVSRQGWCESQYSLDTYIYMVSPLPCYARTPL